MSSASFPSPGGSRPLSFTKTIVHGIEDDEVFTRSAALSYYFVLALFPLLLFLVSLVGVFAEHNAQLRESITSALGKIAPGSASQLVHQVVSQTFTAKHDVLKLTVGIVGAFWAASGGISAIMTALDVVYKTKETRPWWKQRLTTLALTLAISLLVIFALILALYGGKIGGALASQIGMGEIFHWAWKILQWPVSLAAMLLAFSILYYFAPNLKERKWLWITPGSLAGVSLWILASVGFRVYLHFFNHYSATYGSLGAVIILLLWLYVTGFAILTGGEVNFAIKAVKRDRQLSLSEKRQGEEGVSEAA